MNHCSLHHCLLEGGIIADIFACFAHEHNLELADVRRLKVKDVRMSRDIKDVKRLKDCVTIRHKTFQCEPALPR